MKKLGKLPARPGAVSLKFGTIINAAKIPTPPIKFGHANYSKPWNLFSNDVISDCVFAGAAHEHMVFGNEGGSIPTFTDATVISDYSAVTGYLPGNPETDQGTDMQAAASYRRKTGIVDANGVRHKIEAYAALEVGNYQEVVLAASIFGVVGLGLRLPETAESQFDAMEPWSYVPGAKIVGGHYVPLGRLQAAEQPFIEQYMEEGLAYISIEALRNNVSPEGYDLDHLNRFLAGLSA